MTTGATTEGVILGTATYMSPEQARGRPADKRADVWAFGVVWFEMLTGRRAFEGEAISDVLAKVIEREPDWAALPTSTPPRVGELLRRCLRKDPKTRLQAIGDARVQLDEWFSGATEDTPAAGATGPRIHRGVRFASIAAALSLAIVAALAISAALYFRRLIPERAVTRFEISTPPTGDPVSFALSADGRQLAFVADSEGAPRLWVRNLDQVTAQPLPGTEGASYPFWSPDGRAIGFFADGKLKKIDLGSAGPQELASAPSGRGGAWNRDDVLVFAADVNRGVITRVAAVGGTPVAVTKHIPGLGSHRWPQFLPDGRHFIFFAGYGPPDKQGVFVGTVDGGEHAHVLSTETAAVYSPPGVLLWVHQGVIIAQRFDPERKVVSGEPIPVAHAVGVDDGVLRGAFAVSANGVLAHRVARGERRQLTWVDRAGIAQGTVGPPDEDGLNSPELAPDGRRVLVQRSVQGNPDVWMMETGRNVPSRQFTFDASNEGLPLWSPDGGRVVFAALRHGAFNLFEKAASGAGNEQPRLLTGAHKTPLGWSPDGRFLLYATQHLKTGSDLWALALTGDRKRSPSCRHLSTIRRGNCRPMGGG